MNIEDDKNNLIILKAVEDFMNSFEEESFSKIARTIALLQIFGEKLKMPHSKKIKDGIYELRVKGKIEIRIMYSFYHRRTYLLHGFVKKTNKIPKKEIKTALTRFKNLTNL